MQKEAKSNNYHLCRNRVNVADIWRERVCTLTGGISIVRKFLVSGIMVDDEYKESVIGTPQGGNLSPLLANIMLNELDEKMERRGLNFVR